MDFQVLVRNPALGPPTRANKTISMPRLAPGLTLRAVSALPWVPVDCCRLGDGGVGVADNGGVGFVGASVVDVGGGSGGVVVLGGGC